MKIGISFLLAFGLLAFPLEAQERKIEFEEYTLDNGLKVLLHEDHSTPIVAVTVTYHVGSKNENPDRTGFAHFFEHLLFEGSENIGRGEFDMYVQQAGGANNAYTTQDKTHYYEVFPSNQLEMGLWLESERMLHARVEEVGIETQREVVKEERRQRIDNQPYGSLLIEISRRLFREHPYRWPTIGSMEHLNAAQEEDYVNFYKTFYVPNNAVLSIAGDIDIPETKKLIEKYFGTIPRGTHAIPRPQVKEQPITSEIRDTVYDNIQLPAVVQAYRIPGVGEDDFYAMEMLSAVLSQGESSRLYKALVDEQQKALFVGNQNAPLEDYGISLVFGFVNMGVDPKDLETAMDAEVARIQEELISEREFQKVRNQMEAEFISSNASMSGIAGSLADYEMFYGDANLINTELERYMKVTREDIRRVAREYLDPDKRVVLYYLPRPNQ